MKKALLILAGILVLTGISLTILGIKIKNDITSPINSSSEEKILFEVKEGEGASSVITRLKEASLIRGDFWVKSFSKALNISLKPGVYEVSKSMSALQILRIIESGKIKEVQITTIEGWRAEEVANKLYANELTKSLSTFRDALLASNWPELNKFNLKPNQLIEGFLFPDTYRFAYNSTLKTTLKRMVDNFVARTAGLDLTYEDLILASIVEREALHSSDRAKIAGVYKNRLDIGMRLDADPTVQYGKANNSNLKCTILTTNPELCSDYNFWPTLLRADYQGVDSAWNTYKTNTLPPSPISNPGLESIKAALNPENHNYLYFVTDSKGKAHFARTLTEHNANVGRHINAQ